MPKIISHYEMGRTLTWVVVNDDGTVTMRIETSRSSMMKTVSAAEAVHRWPTLAHEIESAVREICGASTPAPLMAGSTQDNRWKHSDV